MISTTAPSTTSRAPVRLENLSQDPQCLRECQDKVLKNLLVLCHPLIQQTCATPRFGSATTLLHLHNKTASAHGAQTQKCRPQPHRHIGPQARRNPRIQCLHKFLLLPMALFEAGEESSTKLRPPPRPHALALRARDRPLEHEILCRMRGQPRPVPHLALDDGKQGFCRPRKFRQHLRRRHGRHQQQLEKRHRFRSHRSPRSFPTRPSPRSTTLVTTIRCRQTSR